MRRSFAGSLVVSLGVSLVVSLAGALALPTPAAAAEYKIVTASERGTYIQIGRDIARFVAPSAGIDLEVLPSVGSAENVQRLRYEQGVKFAIVQSDVYQAYVDRGEAGNAEAGQLIKPLRVIMPLYNEEIYFIARADSPLNFVHDIKDANINLGPLLSGTAMSATTLYKEMFNGSVPDAHASFLSNEDALVKLIGDKSVDVVVVVAGQPAKLLVDMKPEARELVKLLKFDPTNEASKDVMNTYFPATVRAANYPNLLKEDLPSIAVKAFLVTYDYNLGSTVSSLTRFARSMCRNFSTLQTQGHPKWREVDLTMPDLNRGWLYYPPVEREIRNCQATLAKAQAQPAAAVSACPQQERVLGLCK